MLDDREVQIELVELVDGHAIQTAKKTGRTAQNDAVQFKKTQLKKDRFEVELNKLIDMKDKTYFAKGQSFDCLLLHTAEPWFLPSEVESWLETVDFKPRESFDSIYLLFDYDPRNSQTHWPVFQISGERLRFCQRL